MGHESGLVGFKRMLLLVAPAGGGVAYFCAWKLTCDPLMTYQVAIVSGLICGWYAVTSSVSQSDKVDAQGHVQGAQAWGCALGAWSWMIMLTLAQGLTGRLPVTLHPLVLAMVATLTLLWQWMIAVDSQLTLVFWAGLTLFATLTAACYPVSASGWLSVPLAAVLTAVLALIVATFKRRPKR